MSGWAIWFTGLPGSGKTLRAKKLLKILKKKNIETEYLRMDEIRKILTPKKKYTEEERDHAYRALILIGKFLTDNGINVVIDATGHKRVWRKLARKLIRKFVEVYVECPLDICMERESKRKNNLILSDLYKKAIRRKRGEKIMEDIGEVIGIDVEYEEPKKPEFVIQSDNLNSKKSAEKVFKFLKSKRWVK